MPTRTKRPRKAERVKHPTEDRVAEEQRALRRVVKMQQRVRRLTRTLERDASAARAELLAYATRVLGANGFSVEKAE